MGTERAVTRLGDLLGPRLACSKGDLALHGRSETHVSAMPPDAVAYPETTEEVSRLVAICHEEGCPAIPWGADTSPEGHALAPRGGVTVDLSRMDRVLAVRPEDMDARCSPASRGAR